MDATEIAFAGAAEQARMLAAGAITAPELLELYLDRIDRLDPQLNAFRVVLRESARAEAAAAQERLDAGERLPLLGVPVAIKDDVDVAGHVTAWGTSAHGPAKSADGLVVTRLREAGAVLIGKTNVPEMTIWPFTETLSYGATRNPWDTTRTPGGSSGGTAAAVAAGLAAIGLGSDGGGSIRIPAIWCGLYGLKPQRDRVPIAPHDDAWNGLSVNGPLARTVEDAALFLDATSDGSGLPTPDGGFVAAAGRDPGRLRIAISTKIPPGLLARVGRAQRAALEDAASVLRGLGHDVIQQDPDYPAGGGALHFMPRYLRGIADDVASMPHPERLEARTRTMARLGRMISDRRLAAVRAAEPAFSARVLSIFEDVDLVITPGAATGPSRIGAYQQRGGLATLNAVIGRVPFQAVFNATGQPAAIVPWGLDEDGLPLGIQVVARPSEEGTLLALSTQLETARPWAARRPALAVGS
ncbi:MAG: amidase [Solirubrobacterales bacterium]|nr:amidase [Solirubrobacterales bacterium]